MTGPADREVVLALGTNLGDRLANLQQAVDLLCAGELRLHRGLRRLRDRPGGRAAPGRLPQRGAAGRSRLPAAGLLSLGQAAEAALHRVRAERWGPRTLDVDVIAYGDEISADPALTLPHPRAHERAFVLVPWLEVATRTRCCPAVAGWRPGRRDRDRGRAPGRGRRPDPADQPGAAGQHAARAPMTPTRPGPLLAIAVICAAWWPGWSCGRASPPCRPCRGPRCPRCCCWPLARPSPGTTSGPG